MNVRIPSAAALLGAALLPGCIAYDSIDAACPNHIPGERFLQDDRELDMLERFSCYRRYVGLSSLPVLRPIQDAVQAHGSYLDQNQILVHGSPNEAMTVQELFVENSRLGFFTGTDGYDRLRAAQAIDASMSYQLWEFMALSADFGRPDRMMDDWMTRDFVFQPYIVGTGYVEIDTSYGITTYMNLLYAMPSNRRMDNPVVFPRNGQVDVPVSFVPLDPLDPMAVRSVVGFPITVTVGSDQSDASKNPYGLHPISASLVDEHGEEMMLISGGPGTYATGSVLATLGFASTVPLKAGTTYTFEAEIGWNARPHKTVRTTFTTADTSGPVDTDAAGDTDTTAAGGDAAPTDLAALPVLRPGMVLRPALRAAETR